MITRITNLTNGCRYKRARIERMIAACAVAWVEHGVSVRSLNVEEAMEARKSQARLAEPLPYVEIPGLQFEPPASGVTASRRESALVWQAHDFANSHAAIAA